MKDIVVDANVMRLYDKPKDAVFKKFFKWLRELGVLTTSSFIVGEFGRSSKQEIFILINELKKNSRYNLIANRSIKAFSEDRHYKYTCNRPDRNIAKVVFLSHRKKLIAFDNRLVIDVNSFKIINRIQPTACKKPSPTFYE